MKIAVLGTGTVGETLASALVAKGHEVRMGSRSATHEKGLAWAKAAGPRAGLNTFAQAAAFGEVVLNCTKGDASLAALQAAGAEHLAGKVLMDLSNPLDFSSGSLRLFVSNSDSLGEQLQRAFPKTRVVKTLNTLSCALMVNPAALSGPHHVFVGGDDPAARESVKQHLHDWFGWPLESVLDLGDLTSARATEAWLPLWLRASAALKTQQYNLRLVT